MRAKRRERWFIKEVGERTGCEDGDAGCDAGCGAMPDGGEESKGTFRSV